MRKHVQHNFDGQQFVQDKSLFHRSKAKQSKQEEKKMDKEVALWTTTILILVSTLHNTILVCFLDFEFSNFCRPSEFWHVKEKTRTTTPKRNQVGID